MIDLADPTSDSRASPQGALGRRAGAWLVGLAAVVAGLFAFWHVPTPPPEMVSGITPEPALERATPEVQQTVHVAGAVRTPGLVVLAMGARVADAIAAAGGASPAADLTAINLAAPVVDGMQLLVPVAGASTSVDLGAGTTADGMIDINHAGVEELSALPGVGVVLAGRIISYREANGPFGVVEDLLDVSGIGEGKLAAIREMSVAR